MSGVLGGAVVPHAPLLLPEVVGDEVAASTEQVRSATGKLSFLGAEVIVVLSPHGSSSGVYGSIEGSLEDFGVAGIDVRQPTDGTVVSALSELWGKLVLEEPVDHGVLVPLKLLPTAPTVIAAAMREMDSERAGGPSADDFKEAIADGTSFGRALLRLAEQTAVAFVASAHTSSALSPRAPLTERAEARSVEEAVLSALRSDPARLEPSLVDLRVQGGSCSVATLAAYGHVFGGRESEILAYEYPFGVGYVVARVKG